ncbi:MAG TPA: DUF1800 domain-containing protein [Chitinophagales bacterium]|nr:DUF1800 domain-containing protein [Chitinophagales bacterium]
MDGKIVIDPQIWLDRIKNTNVSQKVVSDSLSTRIIEKNLEEFSIKTSQRIGNVTSGLSAYTGVWTDWEKLHLLRRTGFGFKKSDLNSLATKTMNESVDLVLAVDIVPPPKPLNWYQNLQADENGLPYGADWTNNAFTSFEQGYFTNLYRSESLKLWLLHQALNQNISIREKMVQFWYHFIPINFDEIYNSSNLFCGNNSARICYDYIKMFRDNATGNYKQLIRQVATHPAMMYYLNNQANSKTAPDENFAREVMELFTLGNNSGTTYTQGDVVQAAKLLSGWRVQNLNQAYTSTTFVSNLHDYSAKQFSAFFDNTIIPGTGASELDAFIDMIFSKNTMVAEHICRRLYRYFVYYDIDENIELNVIQPLAQIFIQNNWEILPVLNALFKSEHFYDTANRGVMIKSPFDFLIGNMREFNLAYNVSDPNNHQAQYQFLFTISEEGLREMGQVMGEVPNVSGWSAFYQKPNYYQYWINSNTLQKRYTYIQTLFNGFILRLNGLLVIIKYDELAYISQFSNAICTNPNLLVQEVIKHLLPVNLSLEQRNAIKISTLLYNQTNDAYWTNAWNSYKSNPILNSTNAKNRLRTLFVHLLQLAEFHLT